MVINNLPQGWNLKTIVNEDNLTYVAYNSVTQEGIVVDPMREDWEKLLTVTRDSGVKRWISVIDTHTHADHVSCAAKLADELETSLLMSEAAATTKVHLRVSLDTVIPTQAAPLEILMTPGHTPDSITVVWGPFLFTGDTILYGDTGRDDLPGGDPVEHYKSLVEIKKAARNELYFLPGHDAKGGRVSTWGEQLKFNSCLTQDRESFIREASAFQAAAPKNLKESLFENMK
ncbi:MAG: MBL fold metallo-hydrolase [Xanthomonadaceae bacterium]|nr:MBL fold metallo-hydrolase [Xanthomonadaceae bacterium]